MTLLEVLRRVRYFLLRDRYTSELEEEIRLHRELRAERLQGGGLAPDAARYAARRKFGNTTNHLERSRDMWGMDWLEHAMADLRFAVRRLRSRPAFAASTILVAALGIGATTAVFSAVDAALLRPLPFHKPAELVALPHVNIPFDPGREPRFPASAYRYIDVTDIEGMKDVFASVAGYAPGGINLEDANAPRRVRVGVVTSSFFPTLGVTPARGRVFTAEEGRPGAPRVVILSDALWRTQFGGRDILGQTIVLHGRRYDVIGVMPPRFSFPAESELWIPLSVPTTGETFSPFRGYLPSEVIARLAPGVSRETAMKRLQARWETMAPPAQQGRKSNLAELVNELRGTGAVLHFQASEIGTRKKAFLILLGATCLLLLIAAANIANLLLSDGASRRREVALREVMGATRSRIIRQLLAESVLLTLAGAALGLAAAPLALGLMRTLLPGSLAGTAAIQIDLRVMAFAIGLAVTTGIVFGLWPALGTSRVDPGEAIKSGGGHGATSARLGATRRMLLTAELVLTTMLLVGSGLMLKSFHRLVSQDFGMQPEGVGTVEMAFAGAGSVELAIAGTRARRMEIVREVLRRLRADPRITSAGAVNDLPLRGGGGIGVGIELIGLPTPKKNNFPRYLIADSGYFRAMGIPLLSGRLFEASDDTIGERVAIVSKAMAENYWPNMSPLGRTFYWAGDTTHAYAVVGVVADVREGRADDTPGPQLYFSMEERGLSNLALVARSSLPPGQLLSRLTSTVRAVVPAQATFNLRMMDEVIAKSVAPRRTNTLLIGIFGALALVLSAFGVYAVVSFGVAQRSREFGIRAALGADRRDILTLVGTDMALVVLVGLTIGLAGAWALSRVLASLLYEVQTHDVAIYAVVPLVLLAVTLLAILIPSLRATRVSPTEVMRAE